ncbi:FKBP-type peptidyl-prolyl cis-trans isomerase [Janibacter indicus]
MPKAPRLTTAVAASAAAVLALSACGGDSDDSSDSGKDDKKSSASSSPGVTLAEPKEEDSKAVEAIEVTEAKGKKGPSITLADKPVSVSETTRDVREEGDGKELSDDAYVEVDLAMFSGKDGKVIEGSETYTSSPIVLDLGNAEALPGLVKSIQGQKVGASGVSVMPPKDLFGDEGMPEYGVDGKDNLVLVYDVRGQLPDKAEGKQKSVDKDLPQVKYNEGKPADITIPKGATKPKKLVTETLIEGKGKTVKKGDTVYVSYTGVTWDDGKVFDSSLKDGRGPFSFPVGQQSVIPGWDKAVEGAKVGDRLLVVVPPDQGYGKEGTPDGSIKPNSTLVFTIDVLGAP